MQHSLLFSFLRECWSKQLKAILSNPTYLSHNQKVETQLHVQCHSSVMLGKVLCVIQVSATWRQGFLCLNINWTAKCTKNTTSHNKFSVEKCIKVYGPQTAYLSEKQCSIWLSAVHEQVKLPTCRHHLVSNKETSDYKKKR